MNQQDNIDNFHDIFEFYTLMRQISRNIEISRDKSIKEFDLTGAQFYLLYNVLMKEKCTYTELANQSGLAKNTVSILVKPLIKEHLLEQIPEPSDGRKIKLTLSVKGRELVQNIVDNIAATNIGNLKLLSERLHSSNSNSDNLLSQLRYVLDFWEKK